MKSLLTCAAVATLAIGAQLTAAADPTAFAVTVSGQGKPVILIPGLSSSGAVWDGTVAHLKRHYQCHTLTLAGFAGQPRIEGPFLETVRNQLAAYIRGKHLDHPIVIGHSLGGFLALWLASQNPDLTGPLVIVDSLPFLPAVYNPAATVENSTAMAEQMRKAMSSGGEQYVKGTEASVKTMVTSPENYQLVMSWAKASNPAAVASGMYDLFVHDLREDIASITVPTMVLGTWIAYRDNDQDTAARGQVDATFHKQYASLKNVKIVLADDARHFIMLDDRDWFYSQLDSFLSGK